MDRARLSICIPTYNRAPFLERALNHLTNEMKLSFSCEIVISDNCSSDDTKRVVEKFTTSEHRILYFRQEHHVSVEENLANAFRRACGEYLLNFADDDLLIANSLEQAITFLDINRNVVVCYAPWEFYDETAKQSRGRFFNVEADRVFGPANSDSLFEFLVRNHVFPEIGVYRAEIAWKVLSPRLFCYWAFAHLAHYLDYGDVAFLSRPFYRFVLRAAEAGRMQAGNAQAMKDWDIYRGGLEYFVYSRLQRPAKTLSQEQKLKYSNMIDEFVIDRMKVALRLWLFNKDYVRAQELFCRLQFCLPTNDTELAHLQPKLAASASIQGFVNIINSIPINRLVLLEVNNASAVEQFIRELGLSAGTKIVVNPDPPNALEAERSAVLVNSESNRKAAADLGYQAGFVFDQREILRLFADNLLGPT